MRNIASKKGGLDYSSGSVARELGEELRDRINASIYILLRGCRVCGAKHSFLDYYVWETQYLVCDNCTPLFEANREAYLIKWKMEDSA